MWGTSYHLALVELESPRAALRLPLFLPSLSSGALPCWSRLVVWGFGAGSEGEELGRLCAGRWILNDSPTGGGLLPAPGGEGSRASITKTIQSSRRGGGESERKEDSRIFLCFEFLQFP